MRCKTEIDVADLRAQLAYDPATGVFRWRLTGALAGRRGNRGYVKIGLNGKYWLGHRLAWAYVHGSLPEPPLQLDHINRIRHDNRIANLRIATHLQNVLNSDRFDGAPPPARGTTYVARRRRWQAQIGVNGINKYLGSFATQAEAHAAYCAAARAFGMAEATE